jgi:hypothetical protein
MNKRPHNWAPSRLGHGEQQCTYCLATNREIAAIGDLTNCDKAPEPAPSFHVIREGDPVTLVEALHAAAAFIKAAHRGWKTSPKSDAAQTIGIIDRALAGAAERGEP